MKIAPFCGCLATLCTLTRATSVDHGPLVEWNESAATAARVVWLENARPQDGTEGKWSHGAAGFGYGDRDDFTVLPKMHGRYDSLAIRCRVEWPAALPPETVLVLELDYDDGFVAWFDGKEVARRNVIEKDGKARVEKTHEAGRWQALRLGTLRELAKGQSAVLALQGFNDELESSDFSLHPRLLAIDGTKRVELLSKGADWEYLAGGAPEQGWQACVALPASKQAAASLPVAGLFPVADPKAIRFVTGDTRFFGDTRIRVHTVRARQLLPGTEYGIAWDPAAVPKDAQAAKSWPHRFRTAPGEFRPFAFVNGGDMYHRQELLDRMNRRAGLEDPLFALLGGDLAYCNGIDFQRWIDWVDSWVRHARTPDGRLIPMVTAIGNHEVKGIAYSPVNPPTIREAPFYRGLFLDDGQNATHCVDFGRYLSLIQLDSGHAAPVKPQAAFLANALKLRRDIPRLFVCYHRPAYGAGVKEDAKNIQEAWCPLFEQYCVDAVFENDHHVFKRSHPIRAGQIDERDGVPYVGDGAWGVDVRKVSQAEVKKRPWLVKADGVNHLQRVDLGVDGFIVTTKKADGTVIDVFERKWRRAK